MGTLCSYGTSNCTSHLCRSSRSLCWIPLCCLPLPCCCRPVHCCPCPTSCSSDLHLCCRSSCCCCPCRCCCSCCLRLCCSLCLRWFPHRMCQQRWIYCPLRISLRHQCKICTYQVKQRTTIIRKTVNNKIDKKTEDCIIDCTDCLLS